MPLTEKALPFWLVLHRLPNFGYKKFNQLLQLNPNLFEWFSDTTPTPALKQILASWQVPIELDWKGVEQDLKFADQPGQGIITWAQSSYPPQLRHIDSPPMVLFVKGDQALLSEVQMAMVGSRNPTPLGAQNAYHFGRDLAAMGLVVTSGLALGVDGQSHRGALQANGKTIAVLGQGLPGIYPKRHAQLASDIVAKGGAILSEFSTYTKITPSNFPRRNRIISGLSLGVLVVEATIKSGSLITAQFALLQNKEVFAIPGSIHNPLARGCNYLIREGAKCVETVQHILEELKGVFANSAQHMIRARKPKEALSSRLEKILSLIGYECTPIDRVVQHTGLTPEQVLPMLSELELQGQVASVSGGYIRSKEVASYGRDSS